MQKKINEWLDRYFASDEAIALSLIIIVTGLVIWLLGAILAPVLAAIIIAFIMQGAVSFLEGRKVPNRIAIGMVYVSFLTLFVLFLVMLMPLVWRQLASLLNYQLPLMLSEGKALVLMLPAQYPDFVTTAQANELVDYASGKIATMGQTVLSFSISRIPNLMAILIYLVLVPLLVFFFLKDKDKLSEWGLSFLPNTRPRITEIWLEMNSQITNYIRGKFIEIMIIGGVTYVGFAVYGLNYAALLGLLVGLSVVVPYVGAAVVTIPVVVVAYLQFGYGGWGSDFLNIVLLYAVIQALDGNVLVPLLFSEAVNLHPVAIIVAILVLGGLWGLWGVFFAIPIATLVKALYNSWPEKANLEDLKTEQ